MANGLPKRVVFKKPRLDPKIVDLRAKAEEPPSKLIPEKRTKPIDKPQPEPIKHIEEREEILEINNQDETPPEIIHTKSKRTIIIKKDPLPQKQITASDTLIIDDIPRTKTFDEKFLDQMDIKSKITKDTKTQEKLSKPEIKPTVKTKTKEKKKRKFRLAIIISLIAVILSILWLYKVIQDYFANKLDGSLASFMYITINIIIVIIMFIWFILELTIEDKNEKR